LDGLHIGLDLWLCLFDVIPPGAHTHVKRSVCAWNCVLLGDVCLMIWSRESRYLIAPDASVGSWMWFRVFLFIIISPLAACAEAKFGWCTHVLCSWRSFDWSLALCKGRECTHTQANTHTYTHTHTHTHTLKNTTTNTHKRIHNTQTHTNKHTQTHTHTHTCATPPPAASQALWWVLWMQTARRTRWPAGRWADRFPPFWPWSANTTVFARTLWSEPVSLHHGKRNGPIIQGYARRAKDWTWLGLARTVCVHCIWPYIFRFPCQKYRIYMALANQRPAYAVLLSNIEWSTTSTCNSRIKLGLARTTHTRRIWLYIWWDNLHIISRAIILYVNHIYNIPYCAFSIARPTFCEVPK
jgi:hypothetical protein